MKNFKPSELPADTVIKDEEHGVWMKEESGVWGEMTAHCGDCAETVNDDGTSANTWLNGERVFIKADDFFKDFKIIAWPAALVDDLVESLAVEEERDYYTITADRAQILRDAIEEIRKRDS